MSVDAVIFDLDGTLVDNIKYHLLAWIEMGRKLGVEITQERFEREFSGRKNDEIFPAILGRPVSKEELDRLAHEKESRYRELYRPHLSLLAGADALIDELHQAGVKVGIASAAPPENRTFVLTGLKLNERFNTVVGAEDAARGKPHPDLFLAAAKKLGVAPECCLVFEDAVLGIQAARAAKMRVAAVTTTTEAQTLEAAGAEWTMRDFTELPATVRALWRPKL